MIVQKRMVTAAIMTVYCLALSSYAQTPSTDGTKTSTPSGSISGRIVNASGEALPNAIVYVSTMGVQAPARTSFVDGDGSFSISGLEVGVYGVWASAPAFVLESPASPESRRLYHTGDSVTLTLIKGGVITGTVTNNNTPVAAVTVRAFRIRDENGKTLDGIQFRDRATDDRGIYRIYGLQPGTYVVAAGGQARPASAYIGSPYDRDAPTYAPSSTRDTALEITVRSGEEATADIQYRGEPGHAISGTIAGMVLPAFISYGGSVMLTDVRTRATIMNASAGNFTNYAFAFYGVPDGEYELTASQYSGSAGTAMSAPRRVKVQGADITGVILTLASLPTVAGLITLESNPPSDCVRRRATAAQETVVTARRSNSVVPASKDKSVDDTPLLYAKQSTDAVPDPKGEFILRNLHSGLYRLAVQLPSAGWYLRSITLGSNTRSTDAAAEGLTIKNQSVAGLNITITEGAAAVRGRVTMSDGQPPPSTMRVYLVPAEKENLNNVLRFFNKDVTTNGEFTFGNIAPGQYWVLPRLSDESEKANSLREDPIFRSVIRREAENLKSQLTLRPCERLSDYEVNYPSPPAIKQ